MKKNKLYAVIAAAMLSVAVMNVSAQPVAQTTAFTYQGQLNQSGVLANDLYTFTFTLYDNDGVASGIAPIEQSIQVINGMFTTELDFGQVFNGAQYWLEVKVGATAETQVTLADRQPINAVPVAQYALNSPPGARGATGPAGPTGPAGLAGVAGVTGPTGSTGASGEVGPAGLYWEGEWLDNHYYVASDVVEFDGSSYVSLQSKSANFQPDVDVAEDLGHWALLAKKGATGATGPMGAIGATGPIGATGAAGTTGPAGDSATAYFRAGVVVAPNDDSHPDTLTVTFANGMPSTNYGVSLVTAGASTGIGAAQGGCIFNVDSQDETTFTFSCRDASSGIPAPLGNGVQFQYVAVAYVAN